MRFTDRSSRDSLLLDCTKYLFKLFSVLRKKQKRQTPKVKKNHGYFGSPSKMSTTADNRLNMMMTMSIYFCMGSL